MEKTHYRLEFFLHSKPSYRRRLELLEKMETLKKIVKEKGHTGERGLSNMTCYAPYSNYAVCTVSAGGETEWLPGLMKDVEKEDGDLTNIGVRKVFIEPIRPSLKAKKTEKLWVDEASEREKERITKERDEYETVAEATEKRVEQLKEKPAPKPKAALGKIGLGDRIKQKTLDVEDLDKKLGKGIS